MDMGQEKRGGVTLGRVDRESSVGRGAGREGILSERAAFIRRTYNLLAASVLAGAVGASIGLDLVPVVTEWYWLFVLLEFGALLGLFLAQRIPLVNLLILFIFTFLTGFTLAPLLSSILSLPTGGEIVRDAFLVTALVFGGVTLFATTTRYDFRSMGRLLLVALVVLVVAALINIFIGNSLLHTVIVVVGALLFTAFTIYDTQRLMNGDFESPIEAAIALYLDLLNLFISILQILGIVEDNG
ncbi:MAG: Bax inhibitor-1/YccA family protein [Epsilonproteobacteria bacterium]|nr:BAX inhibitor (BI)-1/YccA family protein [Campylobacterota bacterium]NPA56730.1 Bax inhibitor-1/YccA family protein [Campylobacterota bacterium]